MESILVVEDQMEFQSLIGVSLGYKYAIDFANDIVSARKRILAKSYQLILLDVVLPDGSGFNFYREIQSNINCKDVPVIFLTSKSSTQDIVFGFSLGADDYIVKPFDPSVLLARVDIRILKSEKKKLSQNIFKRGSLKFELFGLKLLIDDNLNEKTIDVTPIEFKILLKLAQNSNRILSRQQIMDTVWGSNIYIDDRCIDKHISSIRKKIVPFDFYIKTISGVGYEFKC